MKKSTFDQRAKISFSIAVILVLSVVVGVTALILKQGYRLYTQDFNRDISGPMSIGSDWNEINLLQPIYIERSVNEVHLVFEDEYLPNGYDKGLRASDGSEIAPDIQVVDEKGNVFELNKIVILGSNILARSMTRQTWRDVLPTDRYYKTVRVRSNKSVKIKKIFWRSYDPMERK